MLYIYESSSTENIGLHGQYIKKTEQTKTNQKTKIKEKQKQNKKKTKRTQHAKKKNKTKTQTEDNAGFVYFVFPGDSSCLGF